MVLSGVPWKKSPVTPPEIDPGTVRLVAQRLNHYATPCPYMLAVLIRILLKIFGVVKLIHNYAVY